MTEEKKAEVEGEEGRCDHVLLCPEEWQEPAGRKVIGEYHKEGAPEIDLEEGDLQAFDRYWEAKGSAGMKTEYHKEGAPWLDSDRSNLARAGAAAAAPPAAPSPAPAEPRPEKKAETVRKETAPQEHSAGVDAIWQSLGRTLDLNTLEVASYAVFRALFGRGVVIPIKREGLVDLEIAVKGKDITINTNELYVTVPELVVWKITYAHRGKTIVEFGRGVKNGMKVHRFRALLLGVDIWRRGRATRRLAKKEGKNVSMAGEAEP